MTDTNPVELTVNEDPVTGTWTFTLHGHHIEVERVHGFLKIDGTLYPAPLLQGLQDVHDLAGAPLDYITDLLNTTPDRRPSTPAVHPTTPTPPTVTTPERPRRERRARTKQKPPAASTAAPSTDAHPDSPMLTTVLAASYLGLSPATLETLRTRGGGPPFVKLGRRVVYRRTDLDEWLAHRTRRSTSDPGQH